MGSLSHDALNRATLARQGLLEPLPLGVADGLRAIGAVQAQQWTAVPVALASRLAGFEPAALWAALDAGDALAGIGIRGTLHLVAADEHPAYASTARAGGVGDPHAFWPEPGGDADRAADAAAAAAVLAAAAPGPLLPAGVAEIAEAWVAGHPDAYSPAALAARRDRKWRPLARRPDLVRVPATGPWSAKTPPASAAAPWVAGLTAPNRRPGAGNAPSAAWLPAEEAVAACARAHLRAFGPASAKDVAQWLGIPVPLARDALASLEDVVKLGDLLDLADAPRPDPETPAPPRFLAAFDSLLLAYAPGDRDRVMSPELQRLVYRPGNLRIDPSFLLDGRVAGTWSLELSKRAATITLAPAGALAKRDLAGLEREGDRLLRALAPDVATRAVVVA